MGMGMGMLTARSIGPPRLYDTTSITAVSPCNTSTNLIHADVSNNPDSTSSTSSNLIPADRRCPLPLPPQQDQQQERKLQEHVCRSPHGGGFQVRADKDDSISLGVPGVGTGMVEADDPNGSGANTNGLLKTTFVGIQRRASLFVESTRESSTLVKYGIDTASALASPLVNFTVKQVPPVTYT